MRSGYLMEDPGPGGAYRSSCWLLKPKFERRSLILTLIPTAVNLRLTDVPVGLSYFMAFSINPSVVAFSCRVRTFARSKPPGTSASISSLSVTSLPAIVVNCSTMASTIWCMTRSGRSGEIITVPEKRVRNDAVAQLASSDLRLSQIQVQLFRALGGGWENPQ